MSSAAHHGGPSRLTLDLAIAGRAGHAVASSTQTRGQSARIAHAWIDALHHRAQRAAERRRAASAPR